MEGHGQDYMYEASMTRLVLYATLGLLLSALDLHWDTAEYWCVVALFISNDYLARREGYEHGMVFIATLSDEHLARIRAEVDKILKDKQ